MISIMKIRGNNKKKYSLIIYQLSMKKLFRRKVPFYKGRKFSPENIIR